MKNLLLALLRAFVSSLLIGCQNNIYPMSMPNNSLEPIVVVALTAQQLSTSTPTPLQTESKLPPPLNDLPECKKFGETIYNQFIQTYGGVGCKLPVFSPDRAYLAYITLSRQQDAQGVYFTDIVKVRAVEKNDPGKEIHTSIRMDHISRMEWGSAGQLMVWEAVWEGDWVLFVYDTLTGRLLTKMRADQPSLHWNIQHTAFYSVHTGDYGKDTCVDELGGFDFQTNSPFPDFHDIFGVERLQENLPGIPYSMDDDLRVEPFAWSLDGKKLWVTVTPLNWQGNEIYEYEIQPVQAGVLELSDTGITYVALAVDGDLDYSFQLPSEPKIISTPFQPRTCP